MQPPRSEWTPTENALADHWAAGLAFQPRGDPVVRGPVLGALLIGDVPGWTAAPGPRRMVGVHVIGPIVLEGVKRGSAGASVPQLEATECHFDSRLNLNFAAIDGLWLRHCDLVGIDAHGILIEGYLDLSGSTVRSEGVAVSCPAAVIRGHVLLRLDAGQRFEATGEVRFRGARIGGQLAAVGASLKNPTGDALDCGGAVIGGGVFLDVAGGVRFEADGALRFPSAEIGRQISARGARLTNPKGVALDCDGAIINGSAFLDCEGVHRFEAVGELRFLGADIRGAFSACGASIVNIGGDAINGEGARVKGGLFLRNHGQHRFEAKGVVNLTAVVLESDLSIRLATLDGGGRPALRLDRAAVAGSVILGTSGDADALSTEFRGCLALTGATIQRMLQIQNVISVGSPGPAEPSICFDGADLVVNGTLRLGRIDGDGAARPSGQYRLGGARVSRLQDDPERSWPAKGMLVLDDFSYRSIDARDSSANTAISRLRWLRLQYSETARNQTFKPHPYEHLAKVLREQGRDHDADLVAMTRRDLMIDHSSSAPITMLPEIVMRTLAGHGYRPWLAFRWTAACWFLGVVWISLSLELGAIEFKPVHPGPKPEAIDYVAPGFGTSGFEWDHIWKSTSDGCPGVVAPVYALQLMVPIADFGQDSDCRLESAGTLGGVVQIWRALYQLVGAILIAILGVTLTGVIRKD